MKKKVYRESEDRSSEKNDNKKVVRENIVVVSLVRKPDRVSM